MDIDKCLNSVGSFGLYQKLLSFVLVSYTTFTCGLNYYSQVWGEQCRDIINQNFDCPSLPLYISTSLAVSPPLTQILLFSSPPYDEVGGGGGGGGVGRNTSDRVFHYNYSTLFPTLVSEVKS